MKKIFLTLSLAVIGLISNAQDSAVYLGYTYNQLQIETDSVKIHVTVNAQIYGQVLTSDLYVMASKTKTVNQILAILEDKSYLFFIQKYR